MSSLAGTLGILALICFPPDIHRAKDDPYDLWMSALKGFRGKVDYLGDEGDFSYFRTRNPLLRRQYKTRLSQVNLPLRFPLGEGDPYPITHDMVFPDVPRPRAAPAEFRDFQLPPVP